MLFVHQIKLGGHFFLQKTEFFSTEFCVIGFRPAWAHNHQFYQTCYLSLTGRNYRGLQSRQSLPVVVDRQSAFDQEISVKSIAHDILSQQDSGQKLAETQKIWLCLAEFVK